MISYCYRNNEHQDQYNGNTHGYSCPDPPFKTSFCSSASGSSFTSSICSFSSIIPVPFRVSLFFHSFSFLQKYMSAF